ncbi:MAG: hypothetical protein ACRC4Y_00150 [Cetobacterium sp.]
MNFTFRNIFNIIFAVGFYKILEELYYANKTKKIVGLSIDCLINLRDKIIDDDNDLNEELIFLNQNCKLLNSTSIGDLKSQAAPSQKLLNYILLNPQFYTDYCLKEFIVNSLNSLIFSAIQVESEIILHEYIVNLINPLYYLKKSIHCILENFYSIFSINIPNFIKKILETISAIIAILVSINALSPKLISKFFNWLETLF